MASATAAAAPCALHAPTTTSSCPAFLSSKMKHESNRSAEPMQPLPGAIVHLVMSAAILRYRASCRTITAIAVCAFFNTSNREGVTYPPLFRLKFSVPPDTMDSRIRTHFRRAWSGGRLLDIWWFGCVGGRSPRVVLAIAPISVEKGGRLHQPFQKTGYEKSGIESKFECPGGLPSAVPIHGSRW